MAKDKYEPEIQAVIDRFISGEISLRTKAPGAPKKQRQGPKPSQADWPNSHEEAVSLLEGKKARHDNYYERLANRGHNRTGDDYED